ncbi:helix-turn-helix domain-containing protein, partial [Candidatus Sumerlaeota bacterium]|nr:helix-turn-helix domain-containing protein [Candidatus Sumerlaeota bacterium]
PPVIAQAVPTAPADESQEIKTLAECERDHILRILTFTGWNKKRAAEVLGISRSALYEKIAAYNFEGPQS